MAQLRSAFLLACVCWAASAGCYASHEIAHTEVRNVGTGLQAEVAVAVADGGSVALRPSTNVRLWGEGVGPGDWHDAGDLIFVSNGVATDTPRALDGVGEAFVADLSPGEVARLRELAPVGGAVQEGERPIPTFRGFGDAVVAADYEGLLSNPRWVRVTSPARGDLAAWVRRFVGEAGAGAAPERGMWLFLDQKHRPLAPPLRGAALAGWPAAERLFLATGARWSDLRSVELRSVDPLPTLAAAVPVLPLVFLGALALAAAGADVHHSSSVADLPGDGADRALVTSVACAPPCAPSTTRLFSDAARRRGYVRGMALVGGAIDTNADPRGEIAAGLRLYDLTEIVLVMRGRSVDGGGGGRAFETSLGLGMGLHVPLRVASPWAAGFGLAAGGTLGAPHLMWIDARLGLRRELSGGAFLALPLIASFQEATAGTGAGRWSLGLGLDLGVTF